jgi:hypothetical protein
MSVWHTCPLFQDRLTRAWVSWDSKELYKIYHGHSPGWPLLFLYPHPSLSWRLP